MGQKEAALAFTPISDNSAYSVSIDVSDFAERETLDISEISIPAVYQNLPVTEIGSQAFFRCRTLKSVVIPDGVKNIGDRAFSCTGLTSIVIPKTVEKFGNSIFAECKDLASAKLPDNLKRIQNSMFEKCGKLTDITIPESVEYLRDGAFSGCSSLKSITIPKNVIDIGNGTFSGCGLESITVAGDNQKFTSNGNCILMNNGEYLKAGCKTSVIPKGVKCIGRGAFFSCEGLTNISIPNRVIQIDAYAFYECVNVTKITIPDSVEYADEEVFYGWQKTQTIQVNEQQSQKWKKSWKKGCKAKIEYRELKS
ncbi:MAG: leucine-rich repeat domain-containing protein [Treponema sp.]|nr:leucine-rich repeat domain-containing protein [Treponema sp.]